MKISVRLLWAFLLPSISCFATSNEDMMKANLTQVKVTQPLINELVSIQPIANHHFNLEAPNNCGKEGTIKPSARRIQCQFHSSGSQTALVSVCDNQKKYCKQQPLTFEVQAIKSDQPRIEKPILPTTQEMQSQVKAALMPGFKPLKPEETLQNLKSKKGALVLVSTEWCPPCNLLKELLLPTKEFQELTKDYSLVYVDGDAPIMNSWRSRVGDPPYPTLIIFNNKLQRIEQVSGYQRLDEFQMWLDKTKSYMNDPLDNVESRIQQRMAGAFSRKLLDAFTSKKSIEQDTLRLLGDLRSRMKFVEYVKYLEQFKPENYELNALEAKYENVLYGDESFLQETELEKSEFLKKYEKMILQTKGAEESTWYQDLIQSECDNNKDPVIDCKKALTQAIAKNNREHEEVAKKALASEKTLSSAMTSLVNSGLLEKLGSKEPSKSLKEQCYTDFLKISQFSPLKEKSRAARIYAVSCISSENKSLSLIQSLAEDYPFDSTFHLALSKRYLKQKKFPKALESSEKALTFAYGDNWVKAKMNEANIYAQMGKKDQAKKVLTDCLLDIQMEQLDRRTQGWLARLRGQLNQLDAEKN